MTNEEFQKALATIHAAFEAGIVEYECGGQWCKKNTNDEEWLVGGKYRICPQPREVWIAAETLKSKSDLIGNCYHTHGRDRNQWIKFREVLDD